MARSVLLTLENVGGLPGLETKLCLAFYRWTVALAVLNEHFACSSEADQSLWLSTCL